MAVEAVKPLGSRRRFHPAVIVLGAVVALLILFMLALALGWLAAQQRVRTELARIREAGEPVSAEDLEVFYPRPPAGRDTTQLWLDAIAVLDTPEFNAYAKDLPIIGTAEQLPSLDEPWPHQAAAEALLAKYHEPLEKMHRAAELGGAARYSTDFSRGIASLLPHLNKLRIAARLLVLEAEVEARRQDATAAAKAIEAILAAEHSLRNEPILISQLIRLNLDNMARDELEHLVPGAGFSDNDLSDIAHQLDASDYSASFQRCALGERALGLQTFEDAKSAGIDVPLLSFHASDELVYLQFMRKLVASSTLQGPVLYDAATAWEREVKQFAGEFGAGLRCPISVQILPTFSSTVAGIDRGTAYRDVMRVALAIERYRLRHGDPPKALAALVPAFLSGVPLDPFDGKPLHYRVDDAEYRAYSIGSNRVDDGGRVPADLVDLTSLPVRVDAEFDFVFRVRLGKPPIRVRQGPGERPKP